MPAFIRVIWLVIPIVLLSGGGGFSSKPESWTIEIKTDLTNQSATTMFIELRKTGEKVSRKQFALSPQERASVNIACEMICDEFRLPAIRNDGHFKSPVDIENRIEFIISRSSRIGTRTVTVVRSNPNELAYTDGERVLVAIANQAALNWNWQARIAN